MYKSININKITPLITLKQGKINSHVFDTGKLIQPENLN